MHATNIFHIGDEMTYESIIVKEEEAVAWLTLNKPPLNILDIAMMKEINQALDGFLEKPLKAVVINAEGKAFSAGVDVSDHTEDKVEEMVEVFHGIFRKMTKFESPIISLVKGAALGGGCELAIFCDLVLASERAKFGQPEIMVGVFPPIAALELPNLIPMAKALELILTGDSIGAEEAKQIGLVNQVYPLETFDEESEKFLDKLRGLSASVIRHSKMATYRGAVGGPDALKDIEDLYLNKLMKTHDAKEGLAAFMEKRKPEWKDE
jgi:cyclohexa-1,5-dienecarbonyl-CoA hydratase